MNSDTANLINSAVWGESLVTSGNRINPYSTPMSR